MNKHWAIFLALSFLLAIFLPQGGAFVFAGLTPLMMVTMFIVFLKCDYRQILQHLTSVRKIVRILTVYYTVIPMVAYWFGSLFSPEVAIAFLLAGSMPAGLASVPIALKMNGDGNLGALLVILTHLLTPFILPAVFYCFVETKVAINVWSIMYLLIIIIFIPLIVAFGAKYIIDVQKRSDELSFLNLIVLYLVIYGAVAAYSEQIKTHLLDYMLAVFGLYVLFVFIFTLLYFFFTFERSERIAAATVKVFHNTALSTVLAAKFFPDATVITVLVLIPWCTMPMLFEKFLNDDDQIKDHPDP